MHATLRYLLTKAADLGAMSGVVRRVFRNTRANTGDASRVSHDMAPLSGDMLRMSRNMIGKSDNNAGQTHDMSGMSCDLAFVPNDMEAMSGNYVALSLVSLLRSLNPLLMLRDLAAKMRYELNEWYWGMLGLSDPVERKIHQETDFDDLFVRVYVDDHGSPIERFQKKWEPMPPVVHELLYFLVVDKPMQRDAKMLLAVLLVLARKVLGFTDPKRFWALPWQFALESDSGRRPLSPRPPPFAAC